MSTEDEPPRAGDLVLCRVTEIGQHRFLGQVHGKRNRLFVGDKVVVAYGARYAPDQFEAEVPGDLGPCDLVAGGGIAGRVVSSHSRMKSPTRLEPLGRVTDEHGEVIALARLARPVVPALAPRPRTIAVLGTSMNAGKTTVAAALIRGLSLSGRRVGAAKVTGTGAPGDPTLMADAGASRVIDFTDLGFPTTYQLPMPQVIRILRSSITDLTSHQADAIVLEVADGLLQRETAALMRTPEFRAAVDSIVFAAGDSISAVAGVRLLRDEGLPVVALSGVLTGSPLATAEAVAAVEIPVHSAAALSDPSVADQLLTSAATGGGVAADAGGVPEDASHLTDHGGLPQERSRLTEYSGPLTAETVA
ncbi:malic enzyme protein [Streptomyces regalis]|uniref:Malic enzyme protein n=1 Tax=Streptomyces regalis TaxID=68262 RepID=A0A101JCP6_9ACTN|nr:malic enzyme protein [Streptomyces regalis]